jgi:6-pyruvoyltetrahydropterin/6-carboxytetrahydropterin synthase
VHLSTKTYGHEQGLSATFRQWKAKSHCNQLHGYALSIRLVFGCEKLDSRDWVVDFGALKPLKQQLVDMFDHKTLIAQDDPELNRFLAMAGHGGSGDGAIAPVMDVVVVPAVGCEAFAGMIYAMANNWLHTTYVSSLMLDGVVPPYGLHVVLVEVREHGANSAIYSVGGQA